MNEALIVITIVLGIMLVAIVGIIVSPFKYEQAICTTTRLTNSSFIVCTYKDKILYSGEIKDEN